MNKSLRWKIIFLALIAIFSAISVVPSFYKGVPGWWKKYLAPQGLKLGLDLQGGMHLILKVNLPQAIANSLDFAANDLKEALTAKHISVVKTKTSQANKIIFTVPNKSALTIIKDTVKNEFPNLKIEVKEEAGSFPRIIMALSQKRIDFIKKNAVNQSLEIIRNRIDQFGVSEPVIVRQGNDEIVVQLPGIKDPKRAIKLIGQTAQLEFKMVVDNNGGLDLARMVNQAVQAGLWHKGEGLKKLNMVLSRKLPPNTEVYFETNKDPQTGRKTKSPLLVKSQVMMSGDMVADAQVRVGGNFNEPYVTLDLTGRGGKIFGQITEKNVNKRFAIILDGRVKSAPVIREKILGGRAQISGNFTYPEATDLAIVLRIGALPAPVEIVQNLTVGASLGKDSIHQGIAAGLLGVFLVITFMLFYYRFSGFIADLALALNVLLVFTGLAFMNATLTLPGIAGIILSIGMAVDSNVLIFERMREEFALGKSIRSGVEGGYDKAFWTIVDSQVTTLITALALFLFGTGPIKGFAVTLSFGVTFNLFTTLFGTRLAYDYLYNKRALKKLTFLKFFNKPNLDYMSIRKITFTISTLLALLGMFAFVQILRGHGNLGVDFAGGSMLEYQASAPFQLKEARQAFAKYKLNDIQLQKVENKNQLIIKLKKSTKTVENLDTRVTKILNSEIKGKHFKIISETEIGSSVSSALRDKAVEAIFISLLGIIIYLALRFDIRFGLAGVIAIFHDVLVVIGICYVMNVEMTLLIVTSLLTLAGYSINDSVIVFDRIRENIKHQGNEKNLFALINRSTNEMLSRTIVTSLTTLLSLVALFLLGGVVIHEFAFTLIVGIIVGTYSSIFIASPLLSIWSKEKQ